MADKVRALKLTSIPGENVSQFMQTVIPMLEDIEMCAMTFSQVPNLTSMALKGLMAATDPMISIQVKTMHCEVDGDGAEDSDISTLPEAMAALSKIEDIYRSLATSGYYGPAVPIRPQANLAGVPAKEQQLSQDRGANSTTGNRPARGPAHCWDCDQEGHFKGDPKCPGPKTGTTPTG